MFTTFLVNDARVYAFIEKGEKNTQHNDWEIPQFQWLIAMVEGLPPRRQSDIVLLYIRTTRYSRYLHLFLGCHGMIHLVPGTPLLLCAR